ncbi:cell division protein PerM [Homoserinibacter sp. YIM 151385]|uniref:cell division protein PerM n=1 Tax=Homoserinibacter sp. YIM 151385 TaxID=2985506 RepID=UPI0022F00327|nr:DUF6350 family protein [Homoserinibacter sp. YIM 151385]WBU37751.1 DUF6350 family protein [Homoserinibacter sp. YIM 151385]
MTRRLTVLYAALEALLAVGIGVAIPLVPLTVLWAAEYGFGPDWAVFWRAAVDTWLIGHGVDVTLRLDPALAGGLGGAATEPVVVTLAALGFAVLTLLLGVRAGGRVAETGHRLLGGAVATAAVGVLGLALAWTAVHEAARPSLVQAGLLPAAIFGAGILIAVLRAGPEVGPDAPGSSLRDWIADWPPRLRVAVAGALRAGAASAAIVVLVSAVGVAVLVFASYAEIIRLYESLHSEVAGGIALTLGQLAVVPNLVIWAASWAVGPGFALGTGSTISPLGTAVGPVPAVPILGALPAGELDYGFAAVLVPVAAAFLAGAWLRSGLVRRIDSRPGAAGWLVGTAVGGALVGGAIMGLLAWWSGGSAGPGRLVEVGPDPLLVGAIAAGEFALGLGAGVAAAGVGRRFIGADDGDAAEMPSHDAERRGEPAAPLGGPDASR